MKTQIEIILIFFFLFFISSCKKDNNENLMLLKLIPTTYSNEVIVEGTVEAVNSSTITCPSRISGTIIFLIEDGTLVKKGDTVCILENRESENYLETLLTRVEQSQAQLTKSKASLDMQYALLQAQVKSNEAQTSITNLDSAQLQYLSIQQQKIKTLELQRAAIEKNKIEKKLEFLKKINDSELKKLSIQIARNENQVKNTQSILDEMVMISPQDGMALRANSWRTDEKNKEGDEVWGGMPLVLIPDKSEMKVMIKASESVYKRISPQNKVEYTFNAIPGNMAWGSIKSKAPVGKPIKRDSKVKFFEITASVDSFKVMPDLGLSANCRVILDEVKDTIVVPQLAIFDEDSLKTIYVKTPKGFEKREVLLGNSSPKLAVIIAGLEGTETISLQKPASSMVKLTTLLPDSVKVSISQPKQLEQDNSKLRPTQMDNPFIKKTNAQ